MLCSHKKRFIYIKTFKTAGTSVEIFFEPYCVPDGEFVASHATEERVTAAGIVGSRFLGSSPKGEFYNHMPAVELRAKLGAEIFDQYFKFCVVRNPFDKVVSAFWWSRRGRPIQRRMLQLMPFSMVRRRFARFVRRRSRNGTLHDHRLFMIEGRPVVQDFIRFEHLKDGIQRVCEHLQIDADVNTLGKYKSSFRNRREHFSEYYDAETTKIIEQEFAWEIDKFGYSLN